MTTPIRLAPPACLSSALAVLILCLPSPAAAQHEPFLRALVALTEALPGTYGDEGADIQQALQDLRDGLDAWDARLKEYEANVAGMLPGATPQRAFSMHTTMGALYVARGRLDAALRSYEAAAQIAPADARVQLFLGLVYEAAGRAPEALAAFREAWRLQPDDPVTAYLTASRSLRASAEPPPSEALAALSGAVERIAGGNWDWTPEPFIETAMLRDTLTRAPLFVPARYAAAYTRIAQAKYPEAIAALQAAAAQDPLVTSPLSEVMRAGSAALRAGRVAEARDSFLRAVGDTPDNPEALRLLGLAHWAAAEFEQSVEALQTAVRLDPHNERARLTLARVLEDMGEPQQAQAVLEETVASLPSAALARWRLGRLYAAANRTEDALRELERAATGGILSGRAPLYLEIGAYQRQAFEEELALEAFAYAVTLRPNDVTARHELGRALLQAGRDDEAFTEMTAALLVDPEDPEVSLAIGQMYLDSGKYADAAHVLAYTVKVAPDHAEAHYALANALVRAGQREKAETHLSRFEELQAAAEEARRRQIELSALKLEAKLLTEEGDLQRAANAWEQVIAEQPDQAASHAALAAALAGLGDLARAVSHYERALALDGTPAVYRELAGVYEKMGRANDAARIRALLARTQQDALHTPQPVQ